MTRTAILLFALAIISPPAMLGGLKKPWTPPDLGTASMYWWSPDPVSVEDLEKYGPRHDSRWRVGGCWPEYTAWYNKHHCYSDIDTGQTKCRD
jgi:hypothetical protein